MYIDLHLVSSTCGQVVVLLKKALTVSFVLCAGLS